MSKILVLGDIHDEVAAVELILDKIEKNYDKVIFCGDYFDSWEGTVKHAEQTANWLKGSLLKENRVHIFGNHDLHYRFPRNYNIQGSGFTKAKSNSINRTISVHDWNKLHFFYEAEGFVFSHAGFNRNHLHPINGWDPEWISKRCYEDYSNALNEGCDTDLFCIGQARGGHWPKGGITWQDWNSEFEDVPGIKQIVGHTKDIDIREHKGNYCVDCFPYYIMEICDGKIKKIKIQ